MSEEDIVEQQEDSEISEGEATTFEVEAVEENQAEEVVEVVEQFRFF